MLSMFSKGLSLFFVGAAAVGILAGCSAGKEKPTLSANTPSAVQASPTTQPPTPIPSPTAEPLAIKVNDGGISIAELQAEFKRYQSAETDLGTSSNLQEQTKNVMDTLIDDTLLAQAASQAGHKIDDAALKAREDQLASQMSGGGTIKDWQTKYGYTEEGFRIALRRAMMAAWERDQIINSVPQTAEQVNARQILVLDATLADKIFKQLQAGSDFSSLAATYDPVLGGALGWFPHGYLTIPEVEDAAFKLQPGQYSPVISTTFGYQIVQVIERDGQHQLSPDARRVLQHKALQDWINKQRAQSKIEILVSTSGS